MLQSLGAFFYLPVLLLVNIAKGIWWLILNLWWVIVPLYLYALYKHYKKK